MWNKLSLRFFGFLVVILLTVVTVVVDVCGKASFEPEKSDAKVFGYINLPKRHSFGVLV